MQEAPLLYRPVESPSLTVSELLDSLETDENLHMLKHEMDQRLYILRVKSTVPDRLKERFAGLNQESSGDIEIPNVATISVSDERDEVLVRDGMRLIVLRTILINGYDLVYQTAPASSGMYDDSYSIHKLENLLQSLDPEQLATREELLHWLLSLGDNHDNPDNRYIVEYIIERLDGYRDGSDKAKADRDYEEWMQS